MLDTRMLHRYVSRCSGSSQRKKLRGDATLVRAQLLEGEGVRGRGAGDCLVVALLQVDHVLVEAAQVPVDVVVHAVANRAVVHLLGIANQSGDERIGAELQLDSLVAGSNLKQVQNGVVNGGGQEEICRFHEDALLLATRDSFQAITLETEVGGADSLEGDDQIANEQRLGDLVINSSAQRNGNGLHVSF